MNSVEVQLHDLIHTNLTMLKQSGHKIDFQLRMFRERNLPGFEHVGYTLLQIIDLVECKNSIPWPLLQNRDRCEFRTRFAKFIKMINKKNPTANIPEMTASKLQSPGGIDFLRFMYKLSSFALEVELKRILSVEEVKAILPPFLPSKLAKDKLVKIDIIAGASRAEEASYQQCIAYQEAALPVLKQLDIHNKTLTENVKKTICELENQVSTVHNCQKNLLLDIDNAEAMKEWNAASVEKVKDMEEHSERLCRVRDQATQIQDLLQLHSVTTTDSSKTICLNGDKLGITTVLNELAGCSVVNSRGDVRLQRVMRAGLVVAEGLSPSSAPTHLTIPLLPRAHILQAETTALKINAYQPTTTLEQMMSISKKSIKELRPKIYESMRGKVTLDCFKYLKKTEPLCIIKTSSICGEIQSPFKRGMKTVLPLTSAVAQHKLKVISVKRGIRNYSTPSIQHMKTPGFPKTVASISQNAPKLMRNTSTPHAAQPDILASSLLKFSTFKTIQLTAPKLNSRKHLLSVPIRHSISNTKPGISKVTKPQPSSSSTKSFVKHTSREEPATSASFVTTGPRTSFGPEVSCRKSLYRKLPSGIRHMEEDDSVVSPFESLTSPDSSLFTEDRHHRDFSTDYLQKNNENSGPRKRKSFTKTSSSEICNTRSKRKSIGQSVTTGPNDTLSKREFETKTDDSSISDKISKEPKRKSLLDVIERFNQIKLRQAMSAKAENSNPLDVDEQ